MTIDLLPDQTDLIERAKEKIRHGCKSLLIQAATGSGKTVIASDIVLGAYKKERIVYFLVPRRDLIYQTSETFNSFGIPHTYIASGMHTDPRARIFICSTGTIVNRLSIVPHLVIIDETHFGSEGLDKIIKFYKSRGSVIIGLSASPWKLSGQGLGCWYDDMICGPSIKWLIENKRLSAYRAFAPYQPDLSKIKVTAGDYAKGQLAQKMEQDRVLIGNSVKHYKDHAFGKLGVTFAVSRKHSELLAQAYRDSGIPAMHMDGETPDTERRRIAKSFAKRELLQLCNAELLTFGYDLATASGIKGVNIQCINDCQPTKSLAKQLQKNGRGLRYDEEPHLFFDHANNFVEHGLPSDEIEWTLLDRKKGKKEASERDAPMTRCDYCKFCAPPFIICPNCGTEREIQSRDIKEVDGELQELQETIIKKNKRMEVGMAKTLDDLHSIAEERGYKPSWVWKMAKIKGIRK